MSKSNEFSTDVRELAERVVQEQRGEYPRYGRPSSPLLPRLAACRKP